jgi:hypothetical protein
MSGRFRYGRGTVQTMMSDNTELLDAICCKSLDKTQQWLSNFSNTSAIGFGIFDRQLHYQWINDALAAANGIEAEAHLGRGVREILGEVALSVEPVFDSVRSSGRVVCKDISGRLPHRPGGIYSIACFFPVASRNQSLGALVIDATALHQVDRFLVDLANRLAHKGEKETSCLARELKNSMSQYSAAMRAALTGVTQHIWHLEQNVDEQLAPMIDSLDQRVADMRRVVAAIAARLPDVESH